MNLHRPFVVNKSLAWVRIAVGAVVFVACFWWGAVKRIEPFYTFLYLFCWVPYLWIIDNLIQIRLGRTWIFRGRFFLRLLFFSTTLWLIFEVLNFRLNNWIYAGLPASAWIRWPGYVLSFATVAPGILMTADLISGLLEDPLENEHLPRKRYSDTRMISIGTGMLILPLLFPAYFFPLVWGALFFLSEPFAHRWHGRSLAIEWSGRQWKTTLSLLWAGLVCGLFWEVCNFKAGAKWTYSIPFVNFLKIFEMPLLGYLGFPAFAIEVFSVHEAFEKGWGKLSKHQRRGLIVLAVLFWVFAFWGIDRWSDAGRLIPFSRV